MVIDKIALTLAIIGMLSRVIYTLVGLAGIWCITMLFREKEPMESGGQV